MDIVSHLSISAIHDMMAETWGEVQETAGKEAYGSVEVYDGD